MFIATPMDAVQLVFTMTHLYPSSGVLADMNNLFNQCLSHDNIIDCKYWGKREQTSDCFGIYYYQPADEERDCVGLMSENPIEKTLQIDLLNSCYTRRRLKVSSMDVYLGQDLILSLMSATMSQRYLLFPKSWPEHLSNALMLKEICLKLHPRFHLNVNSFGVKSLSAHGAYMSSHIRGLATAIKHYLRGLLEAEVGEYSGQLREVGLVNFFSQAIKG